MNEKSDSLPLVSCTVLSYNSETTVLETLESIKAQTYRNIELIVSDDNSKDNTVELCRQWIEQNRGRFVRTELLTVEKNTGVCANSNRALAACRGEWTKGLAADDIMLPNCVEDYILFVSDHPEISWASSYYRVYINDFKPECCIAHNSVSKRSFFNLTAEQQLNEIAPWNLIAAAPNFYSISVLREVGGFDMAFSFEDYPLFVTLLEHGYKCWFMDKETVGYRIHDSISNSSGKLFNYNFLLESKKFHKERTFKYLTTWQKMGQYSIWGLQSTFEKLKMNKDTRFNKTLYRRWLFLLKKMFNN